MLTRKQKAILDFLLEYARTEGGSPSIDEIRQHFGLRSVATVHKHLKAMEARGVIRRSPGRARALEVLPMQRWMEQDSMVALPVLDDFRAPFPEGIDPAAPQRVVSTWGLSRDPSGWPEASVPFLYQQKNDSLAGAGILRGDWLVVLYETESGFHNQREGLYAITVDNVGSIVRFVKPDSGGYRIRAAHSTIRPFRLEQKRVRYCGHILGVIRQGFGADSHEVQEEQA